MIERTKKEILSEVRKLVSHALLLFVCVAVACFGMYMKEYIPAIMLGIMAIVQVIAMDSIMDCIKLDLDMLELVTKVEEVEDFHTMLKSFKEEEDKQCGT